MLADSLSGDIETLEAKARESARRQVANMLQSAEQLEKVDHIRRGVAKKTTAVQNQLDGVRTGLTQLQTSLQDIKDIKESLMEIDKSCIAIEPLYQKLGELRSKNAQHMQLASAVENLHHIFNVPESVKRCQDMIENGKLLYAHKTLCDLERARDELLFELHRQKKENQTDKDIIMRYFADVDSVAQTFSKQLWLVLSRTLITVRREPINIVTVLRIIEREERTDSAMLKRREQTGFMPPTRPNRWRDRAMDVINEAVVARVEGSQMEDRTTDKMWLVRHLEVVRQLVVEDLMNLCEPCFPTYYDIVDKYVEMYHNCIGQHMSDIIQQGLESNEIVTLLSWVNDYTGEELMGHPSLKLDTTEYGPLLKENVKLELTETYLRTLRANFKEWMSNSLDTDFKDWNRDQPPDSDHKGFYHTQLPVIQFEMIEQNLQVASTINEQLVHKAVVVIVEEMGCFLTSYRALLKSFKEKHLLDRNSPLCYLAYMIANVNNCHTFKEQCLRLKVKYCKEDSSGGQFSRLAEQFDRLGHEAADYLIDEVFLDITQHVTDILSKKWIQTSHQVDTILMTIEDYCGDFVHLRDKYFDALMLRMQSRILFEYLRAFFARKVKFSSYDDRAAAAEKIGREAEQLERTLSHLCPAVKEHSNFLALSNLSEILKMRDTTMMSLELSGVYKRYPSIKVEQLVNVMLLRGDMGRAEARQMVVETIGEDESSRHKKEGIFSNIPTS